jgi:hypothetical protein
MSARISLAAVHIQLWTSCNSFPVLSSPLGVCHIEQTSAVGAIPPLSLPRTLQAFRQRAWFSCFRQRAWFSCFRQRAWFSWATHAPHPSECG